MEQIGIYIATITSGTPEERLRALAPLGLAIALFLAEAESSNDVALLLTVLEQAITTIANTGRALALGQLREIAGALENFHCRSCRCYCIFENSIWQSTLACTLTAYNIYCSSPWPHPDVPLGVCVHIVDIFLEGLQTVLIGATVSATSLVHLPTWGTIDGDLFIREIAFNCQLVHKGTGQVGGGIASFWWVLILPDRLIDALIQGELDVSGFPQHQLNPCLTFQTAMSKALHWCRQAVLSEEDSLSAFYWRPSLPRVDSAMKQRSGVGGQRNWHNTSYIGASYCGIITGENGLVRLSAEELENAFALRLRVTIRQCIGGVLMDAYQGDTSSIGVHRHLRYPLCFRKVSGVPTLSLLNVHGLEAHADSDHLCDWSEELPRGSEPSRVTIEAPRGIEVIVKNT